MNDKNKPTADDNWLKDMPIRSEDIAFASDKMLACGKCGRSNPPNRLQCLYCAADLEIPVEDLAQAKPSLRRLESWEKGFNVIATAGSKPDVAAVAREFSFENEVAAKILSAKSPLPLARVEGEREAELVSLRLKSYGVETQTVADEQLHLDRLPRRIRALDFQGDNITATDFNTRETISIPVGDLILMVSGTLFELKTASLEKRKRKSSKLLDQSEISDDESLLDLYTRDDVVGLRVYRSGFDFSCLGENKGLLAAENLPKLIRRLMMTCVNAKLDEAYDGAQDALGAVWEVETRKDFEGLRRSGFGKADFANVVTVSNQMQFNRYSRLQRQLI